MKPAKRFSAAAAALMLLCTTVCAAPAYAYETAPTACVAVSPAEASPKTAYNEAKKLCSAKYNADTIKLLNQCKKKNAKPGVPYSDTKTYKFFNKISSSDTLKISFINKNFISCVSEGKNKMSVVMCDGSSGSFMYITDKTAAVCDLSDKTYKASSVGSPKEAKELMKSMGGTSSITGFYSGIGKKTKCAVLNLTYKDQSYTYEQITSGGKTMGMLYNDKGSLIGMTNGGTSYCCSFSTKLSVSDFTVPKGYTKSKK